MTNHERTLFERSDAECARAAKMRAPKHSSVTKRTARPTKAVPLYLPWVKRVNISRAGIRYETWEQQRV